MFFTGSPSFLAHQRALTEGQGRSNCQTLFGMAAILEGMDELLTVVRLKLPLQLRRSLACTNIIENMMC